MDMKLVKELVADAGITPNNLSDGGLSLADLAKFVELIVREAADVASWSQDQKEADIGAEVLAHFGLEPEDE